MKFIDGDEEFEIFEGDEVCLLPKYETESTRPQGTGSGVVQSVVENRVGVRWFGVGGHFVYYYPPHELSQIGPRK